METLRELVLKMGSLRPGIPQFLFMDGVHPPSMFKVRKAIISYKKENGDCEEIDFILQSGGGLADDAYRIIRTLRNNFKTVNIIVPFWAKSAATLLALGGSKIIMDEFGEFGPLDAQIGKERDDSPQYERESALNDEHSIDRIETRYKELFSSMFVNIYKSDEIAIHKNELAKQLLNSSIKFYEPLLKQINPYRLGEKRRILNIGKDYAEKILAQFNPSVPEGHSAVLVDYLVNRCSEHGFIIDYKTIYQFLPNIVQKTSEVSQDYENAVSDLTGYFLSLRENAEFVGFIIEQPTEETEGQVADENQDDVILDDKKVSEIDLEDLNTDTNIDDSEVQTNDSIEDQVSKLLKLPKTKSVKKTLSTMDNK